MEALKRVLGLLSFLICLISSYHLALATTTNVYNSVSSSSPLPTSAGGTGSNITGTVTLTDASTVTVPDPSPFGTAYTLSLTTAVGSTRAIANPTTIAAGQFIVFVFTEDSSGGEGVTWGTDYKATGGPLLINQAPSAKTYVQCLVDTTSSAQCWSTSAVGFISGGRSTSSTSDAPTGADCGYTITYSAATAIAVTLPTSGVPIGGWCWIAMLQTGAGKITPTISAAAPHNAHTWTGSNGQYSVISVGTPDGGTTWYLVGDGS
jgi:hypothetical protein